MVPRVRPSCLAALLAACAAFASQSPAVAQCARWSDALGPVEVTGGIAATAVHDDGAGSRYYVAGSITAIGGVPVQRVARWDGASWSTVGNGLPEQVYALASLDLGAGPRLFAGLNNTVWMWDGAAWTQFGTAITHNDPNHYGGVYALIARPLGAGTALVAGGDFDRCAVQWTGTAWSMIAPGLDSTNPFLTDSSVRAMALHDFGAGPQLVVAGEFGFPSGPYGPNVARLAGATWENVGSGWGGYFATSLVSVSGPSGPRLVLGGQGDLPFADHVASWNGSGWAPLGGGADGVVQRLRELGPVDGHAAGVWAGGSFASVGGQSIRNLARWDGSTWRAPAADPGVAPVMHVDAFDAGSGPELIVGSGVDLRRWSAGAWERLLGGGGSNQTVRHLASLRRPGTEGELWAWAQGTFALVGGVNVQGFGWRDAAGWHSAPIPQWSSSSTLARLNVVDRGFGPRIVAVGRFPLPSPTQPVRRLMERVDGAWQVIPSPAGLPDFTHASDAAGYDDGTGPKLHYAAATNVWRLDGSTWTSVAGASSPGPFTRLHVHDDGGGAALYASGEFTSVGGTPCRRLGRWDGSTFQELAGGANAPIEEFASRTTAGGSELYVHGIGLTEVGGVAVNGLARWNGAGWSAVPLPPGVTSATDLVLAVSDDGSGNGAELVIGYVDPIGGLDAFVARGDGQTWRAFEVLARSTPSAASIHALVPHDAGDGQGEDLWVGGSFGLAGTVPSSNLARWTGCGGEARTYCRGDDTGTPCPCGNASPSIARAGCRNSLGTGGTLRARGAASLSRDTLVLEGAGMPDSSALYFQGAGWSQGGSGHVFGDGLKCTVAPFRRLGTKVNAAGASAYPVGGDVSVSVRGAVAVPGTRYYQVHYRNAAAFCTSDSFNYSNGVVVAWGP